jgi:hypothetical protein
MRDWGPIPDLYDELKDPATAAAARRRLIAFAGQDHGTDARVWHEALRVLLREDTATALAEMGVLDEEVRAWMENSSRSTRSISRERSAAWW